MAESPSIAARARRLETGLSSRRSRLAAGRQSPRHKLVKHLRRAHGYARTAAWLLGDLKAFVRWRLLAIVAAGIGHIVTKFAAAGVIYLGVHSFSGEPAALPWPGLPALHGAPLLALLIAAGVALLGAAALLRYEARRQCLRLTRRYLEFCMRRAVAIASRLPDPRAPEASRLIGQDVPHLFLGYGRVCGLASQQLLRLAPTFASFLAGCAVLLWLDAGLTALLALFALLSLIVQYPANNRAARASHDWERGRREAGRRMAQAFSLPRRDRAPLDPASPALDAVFRAPVVRGTLDSLIARILAGEKADLVSRVGSGVLLGGVIFIVGADILEGSRTWAGVAAYLAAVRFTLTDFVSVSRLASGLNRYHAQIERYRQLVVGSRAALAMPPPGEARLPLRLRLPGRVDPGARLALEAGAAISVMLTPHTGTALGYLLMRAIHLDKGQRYVPPLELDDAPLDPELPLRGNFALPGDVAEEGLAEALAAFTPTSVRPLELAPGWLDRPPAATELPRWALRALRVLAATARGAPLASIGAPLFAQLPEVWRQACRRQLARSALLIVHRDLTHVGQFGEQAAILCDGRRLTGWVPFPAEPANAAALRTSFMRLAGARTRMLPMDEAADEIA
jgi:hypothetical protein